MNKVKVLARCGAKGVIKYFDGSLNFPFVANFSEEIQIEYPVPEMFNVTKDGQFLPSAGQHELDLTHYYEGRTKIPWPVSVPEYEGLLGLLK